MADLEEYKAQQAAEYGAYVANGPIYIDGALAFVEGHAVPKSTVEANKYVEQGLVREAGTEAPAAQRGSEPQQGQDVVLNVDPADNVQVTADAEAHTDDTETEV
jgi:hypothetical protein